MRFIFFFAMFAFEFFLFSNFQIIIAMMDDIFVFAERRNIFENIYARIKKKKTVNDNCNESSRWIIKL